MTRQLVARSEIVIDDTGIVRHLLPPAAWAPLLAGSVPRL